VPGPPARLLAGVIPPDTLTPPDALLASWDAGDTWVRNDGGIVETRHYGTTAIALDPRDPSRIYWAVVPSLLRSDDAGDSWRYLRPFDERCLSGDWLCGWITAVAVSAHGRVWYANQDALFQSYIRWSDDAGATWRFVRPVPGVEHMTSVIVPDPVRRHRVWAAGGLGVLRSNDGGETWTQVLRLDAPGSVTGLVHVNGLLYAASVELTERQTWRLGLYRSRDGGHRWEALPTPEGADGAWSMTLDRDGSLLIGTRSGVWRVSR
jgi:hypothetical protein